MILVALLVCLHHNSRVLAFSATNRITMKVETSGPSSLGNKIKPKTSSTSSSGNNIPPGSPLAMILLDQQEFELEVGHAMDVLRKDYPDILHTKPGKTERVLGPTAVSILCWLLTGLSIAVDFSIYDQDLELIDPSGVKLHGVQNYKAAFRLLHAVVSIFYCPNQSILRNRMCFDKARQNIRIHWNAEVIPKAIFGGQKSTLHVDGISVYEVSRVSGNITQHRIERLIINDTPIVPEQGIFAALRGYYNRKSDMEGIPVWNSGLEVNGNEVVPFRTFAPKSTSFLFHQTNERTSELGAASPNASDPAVVDSLTEAWETKNAARKKFGVPPLTLEEFAELQEQVSQMEAQQQQRSAAAAAELAAKKKKEEQGGFFKKLFGEAMQNTCESNFDCQRPEVCCDFGFKKMCCSSGMRVLDGPKSRYGQLAEVPVIANPGPNYPPLDPPPRY